MASVSRSRERPVIRKWSATYYIGGDKKWLKGELRLSHNCLSFHELSSEKVYIAIDLDSISEVKVERAWFGYNTVVVVVGSRKFWFASFESSQSVRRVLLHFVRENLLNHDRAEKIERPALSDRSGSTGSTDFGRELLSLAHDSQRTLSGAASQLVAQGEQIDGALRITNSMHLDLGVANIHITHLESWVGLWHVSLKDLDFKPPQNLLGHSKTSNDTEFPVIYRLSKHIIEESGTLKIGENNLTICDERKRTVVAFVLDEISSVVVLTPWSMLITRRLIGRPDVSCHVTSAKLLAILKILEFRLKGKIEYDEPSSIGFTSTENAIERCTLKELLKNNKTEKSEGVPTSYKGGDWSSDGSQAMINQSEIVTDSEVSELNSVLRDLKSLAVGVGSELEEQDEKVSQLTNNVDNLTDALKRSNRRMDKLLK